MMVDLHPTLKFTTVLACAFITTCLCFYLMMFLISQEISGSVDITVTKNVRPSVAEDREEQPIATRTRPQKHLPLQPPSDPNATQLSRPTRAEMRTERPKFGSIADMIGPADIQLTLEAPNSDLVPISIVQPIYPLRAAMREIEGFVIVEFSVRENGTVLNPIVVQSEPRKLFDEAALNAASRFRYKPREIGGENVRVDKVQLKFAFTLESLYDYEEQYR